MPTINPIPFGQSEKDVVARIGNLLKPEPAPEAIPEQETEGPATEQPEELVAEPTSDNDDPASEAAEAADESVEETSEEVEPDYEPAIDPPASWSDTDKNLFTQLPPEAQQIIVERESQRDRYLTQKGQEASEQVRQAQEMQTQIEAQRQYFEQTLSPMIQQWAAHLQSDEQRLSHLIDPNSDAYDPEQYLREQARITAEKAQLEQAEKERQSLEQQRQEAQKRELLADVARNEQELLTRVPEWGKDPNKGKAEIQQIREFVVSQGVPAELASEEYRAPMILLARDAMRYRNLMNKRPEAQRKLATAPKMQKPGVKKVVDPKKEKHVAARQQLRRASGRREADAFVRALKTR